MKEYQRRLPGESTQQVDSPDPILPGIQPEIFSVPSGDAPYEDDFAVYLDI